MNILVEQFLLNRELATLPTPGESGQLPALITGLSPEHRAHFAAALRQRSGKPLTVICQDDTAAESMAQDIAAMLGEEVTILGMREFTFYPVVAASHQTEQQRLAALYKAATGGAEIFVASVTGLLQRTIPAEVLTAAACAISAGETLAPEKLEAYLQRGGYERTTQVEGAGQFSRRGGIMDFYSPADHAPVRIEFWGDEIDSMGYFDIATQRRTESIDRCVVLPAAETLPDYAKGGREALADKIDSFAKRYIAKRDSKQAMTLGETLRADAEKLRNGIVLSDADRYLPMIYPEATGADYIREDSVVILSEPGHCADKARSYLKQLGMDIAELQRRGMVASGTEGYCGKWEQLVKSLALHPVYMADSFTKGQYPLPPKYIASVAAKQLPGYGGNAHVAAEDVQAYLKQDYRVLVLAGDARRAAALENFFREAEIPCALIGSLDKMPEPGQCFISVGSVSSGMEYPGQRLAILTDAMLRKVNRPERARRKLPPGRERIESYADLSVGDYVVHESYGIGIFQGIVKTEIDGQDKDYIRIKYAGSDELYIPATQLDVVSKYTGGGEEKTVKLNKIGGTEWAKTRFKAKASAKEMAQKLIQLYAERLRLPGYAFSPDSEWQQEFEDNFGYVETEDQLRCVAEIKRDMESSTPMDRLLCGDVGFGKTEVALRAVMKCILDGKQAAILVPTTVLAQQHYQTALQRFFGFPVNIAVMNRFRTGAGASKTLAGISNGKVDLVIGTHRLLSKDVQFKNLGLLVVDEEQRFGVTHKEHIKELSRGVDVLTLTATPIPRTMNMALSGIRDMSTLEEPPEDRLPVQTFVMEHDWETLADAMRRELQRGGQVYYLHNRVADIEKCAKRVSELLEGEAVVGVAHGQMDKSTLSSVMESVVSGEVQVLVCTTIIETGIDIPNVNTLIIEDADKLGLAQLHQIRGRVGRSTRKASAYLTFRENKVITEDAEKRLEAIRAFAQFGSGVKIAMRDLEIRGAGNLLGQEQSGHMLDVGYDLYMKLLNEAVLEARGIKLPDRAECSADLAVAANIPEAYIPSPEQRMDIYRKIALIRSEEEADDLMDEIIDRFGDPPPGISALVQVALLRVDAGKAGITDITQKAGCILFTVKDLNVQKLMDLYALPEYKGRLTAVQGDKPRLSLRVKSKLRVLDEARAFSKAWGGESTVASK